jgi:hypothetical protein
LERAKLHASHPPVQAESQQTPSAQCPDVHCASEEHTVPSPSLARQSSPPQYSVAAQLFLSAGQSGPAPPQTSPTVSQAPAAARQGVGNGRYSSAGQSADVPVHTSSASQGPAAGRQTPEVHLGPTHIGWWIRNRSTGQLLDVPSQVSTRSQGPAVARQTVPASAT